MPTPRIVTKNDVTPTDLENLAGKTGTVELDGLTFRVTVLEARIRFGHLDFHVTPCDGTGKKWVEAHRVIFTD